MLESFERLLTELAADFGRAPSVSPPASTLPDWLPPPLKDLYGRYNGVDLFVGSIYSIKEMEEQSKADPLPPHWLQFGGDNGGTFWLCRREPVMGMWFACWDRDGESGIPAPYAPSIGEMLHDEYLQTLQLRASGGNEVRFRSIPEGQKLKVVAKIKATVGGTSSEFLSLLSSLPATIDLEQAVDARNLCRDLQELGVDCYISLHFP
jgi:hypothetical protein